jgi:hypothetical protein
VLVCRHEDLTAAFPTSLHLAPTPTVRQHTQRPDDSTLRRSLRPPTACRAARAAHLSGAGPSSERPGRPARQKV